jgi:hypothetical protein
VDRFQELQKKHIDLLRRYETNKESADFLKDVQEYTQQVLTASREINDSRERNQLRANLRFWGAYIYDHTGTYPNLTLLPSEGRTELPPSERGTAKLGGIAISSTSKLGRIAMISLVLLAVVFIGRLLALNRVYPPRPPFTNTPINPTSLFATSIGGTPAISMSDIANFATGTALAETGTPPAIPVTSGLIRIKILEGETTTLVGIINVQANVRYVLSAMYGQTLNVKITSTSNEFALAVYSPNGTALKDLDTNLMWSGKIPSNGDYIIEIVNKGGQSNSYTLEIGLVLVSSGFTPKLSYLESTCSDREVEIAWRNFGWDPSLFPTSSEIENAVAYLSLLGSGDIVSQVNVIPNGDPAIIELGNPISDQSYFLQVKHSNFLFEPLIIQFTSECIYNHFSITYGGRSKIVDTATLDIDLSLVDWGPDSLASNYSWIAKLSTKQDENGIYMDSSGQIIDQPFIVRGVHCSSAPFTISRSSNGKYQEVVFSLFLTGPLCPKTE